MVESSANTENNFVGVKREKIKRLYLGGVREGIHSNVIILNIWKKKGGSPTFVRLFTSERKGTVGVRVIVKSEDFERVCSDNFWPEYVYAREWLSKRNWINKNEQESDRQLSQDQNVSTLERNKLVEVESMPTW